MKRIIVLSGVLLILLALPLNCLAAQLIPIGQVVGLQLKDDTVMVAAFDQELGSDASQAGLRIGDRILAINGTPIQQAEQVPDLIKTGETAKIKIQRGTKQRELTVPLISGPTGQRLGVYLRQGIAGIGTVTWYDPETGLFGALGHGVSDSTGGLLRLTEGKVWQTWVESVKKGTPGNPGQLRGKGDSMIQQGSILRNTPQGVFGKLNIPWPGEKMETADFSDIQLGSAQIRSTISGDAPQDYSVEIMKIYPQDRPDGRNFLIKITDPALLEATGGIVQGMSGSPLLQNGKIIGAVTHVLVNDPTTGYGIFIENMLEAAG